jgi:hypothetical protein
MNPIRFFFSTILFLSIGNLAEAQNDSIEKFVILEAGFLSIDEFTDVQFQVDRKWNIQRKPVAGCMVSSRLADSIDNFNRVTNSNLEKRYGKNWGEQYESDLDEAYTLKIAELDSISAQEVIISENVRFREIVHHNRAYSKLSVSICSKENSNFPSGAGAESQVEVAGIRNLQDDRNDILYRGFPNLFEIMFDGRSGTTDYELECTNCTISKVRLGDTLPIHQYVLRPGSKKEATLTIHSSENHVSSYHFKVSNLPDPELYFSDVRSGRRVDVSTLNSSIKVEARYPDEITLKSEFVVQSWEVQTNGEEHNYMHGNGNVIPEEVTELIKQLKTGAQFSIICTVSGPDGIRRKKAGAFIVQND